MFDRKTIRRRRAALIAFVAAAMVLITISFGGGGPLGSIQQGAQDVVSPIENGANRALKPVRDLVGWLGDTFSAKGDNEKLRDEVAELRKELAARETTRRDAQQLRGLVGLRRGEGFPEATNPVAARVIARSPTVWYSTIRINKGRGDGIRVDQPVIAAGGLAGKVTRVSGGSAQVTLITDSSSAVSAQVVPNGANGIIKPEVGKPDDLLLDFVQKGRRVRKGSTVVTSGFASDEVRSIFPRGIPVGRVSRVDLDEVELYQRVHIKPFADLRRIDFVQVLTQRPGTQAQVPTP
jgi:rod shape-determining protein MreC